MARFRFQPLSISLTLLVSAASGQAPGGGQARESFNIPQDYLAQVENIPDYWVNTVDQISKFLDDRIRKGIVQQIGTTAGGRPIRAVFYGKAREGKGTTTFSGSLGLGDVRAYLGPDHAKKVYMAMASVHGGEVEAIAGMANLLSVLETGRDLRGKEWPAVVAAAGQMDRIILIPITNVDGRARVPIRMLRHRGPDYTVVEYFNTGGWPNGKIIGWPECKRFIPLDFSTTQFPGGYPNDAGVNIQHDDFFGKRQPETNALFDLTARERPDLILNLHTGATFAHMLKPFCEPALMPAFNELYRSVQAGLTVAGLQSSDNVAEQSNAAREKVQPFNLDSALNLSTGALSVTIESPSHGYSDGKRAGKIFVHTTDHLVDIQLICHRESMNFLAKTGGRSAWTAKKRVR